MNLKDWLDKAVFHLCMFETAKYDAERILEKVTKKSNAYFLGFGETLLTPDQEKQADALLLRRIYGEPLAYLVEEHEFWSLSFKISSGVFIPRFDTECLVEQILLNFSFNTVLRVLDLGTGSGAIALALASERPHWEITGVDFLFKAVNLARENISFLKIKNATILLGNWFQGLKKNSYDLIVSNPPYIDKYDPNLLLGDVRFEPKTSLISNNIGLYDLSYICCHAVKYLKSGGWLFLEHGWTQGESVRYFFLNAGYEYVTTVCDYNNNERVTYGQLNDKHDLED